MTSFEQEPINEELLCVKAVDLYMEAKVEFSEKELNQALKKYPYNTERLGHSLLTQSDGLRLGAPGYSDVKLRYNSSTILGKNYFFLNDNYMNPEEFKKWEIFVGKRFEDNRLPFKYSVQKDN